MKKISILFILVILCSCGEVNRQIMGNTEKDLIKQVSIETGCSSEKIIIIEKIKNFGNATYALDVCGKRVVYKQVGSVFMTALEADKIMKKG